MKYLIHNQTTPIQFTKNEFIFKGGEGSIYSRGSLVYKIYEDPKRMIPYEKIDELKILNHKSIIRPKDLIYDQSKNIVGFTMDKVDGIPLCKLFTNSFRSLNNIKPNIIIKLVDKIIGVIVYIHDKKCLIVDGNEMNYMVDDKTFQIPYFIDVNSYQTPSFPATSLMMSIKDYHSNKFSELTDWFSFAVVSCNLFIGIHPFKGGHKNYKPGFDGMMKRMKDNVSIFHSGVSVPKATRDFSYIPTKMREWYIKVFEKGERIPPPFVVGIINIKQVKTKLIISSDNFEITLLKTFKSNIISYKKVLTNEVIKTENKIYINNTDYNLKCKNEEVVFSRSLMSENFIYLENGQIIFRSKYKKYYKNTHILAQDMFIYDNTIFIKNSDKICGLSILDHTKHMIPIIKSYWNIMKNSSIVLDGFLYQNILGKSYLCIITLLLTTSSYDIPIPELDKYYKIISGKRDENVCMLITYDNNKYYKIIIRFSKDFKSYDIRSEEVDIPLINFICLKNGICISINSDDSMEIFSSDPDSKSIKRIEDPDINSSFNLCKSGMDVLLFKDNELFKIKMKGGGN